MIVSLFRPIVHLYKRPPREKNRYWIYSANYFYINQIHSLTEERKMQRWPWLPSYTPTTPFPSQPSQIRITLQATAAKPSTKKKCHIWASSCNGTTTMVTKGHYPMLVPLKWGPRSDSLATVPPFKFFLHELTSQKTWNNTLVLGILTP